MTYTAAEACNLARAVVMTMLSRPCPKQQFQLFPLSNGRQCEENIFEQGNTRPHISTRCNGC